MGLVLDTPPTSYPVTLTEAKAQCRIEEDDSQDGAINIMIAAATSYVEQYLGRSLMPQTWRLTLDRFQNEIVLPKGPVTEVTEFQYFDADNAQQDVDAALYEIDVASDPPRVLRAPNANWPVTAAGVNKVVITYTAAYDPLPAAIKHAIQLLIAQWFDSRTSLSAAARAAPEDSIIPEVPHAVTALLSNFRSFAF